MTDRWSVALQLGCADTLRSFRRREQESVIGFLEWLGNNATQPVPFAEKSADGREVRVWIAGRFLISYWLDHAVKEVRVVRVERVKFIKRVS